MSKKVYKELLEVMKKRGGGYSGKDIPEFYELVQNSINWYAEHKATSYNY